MSASTILAARLLMVLGVYGQNTIYSGSGFGTYYYDVQEIDACGTSFEYQNMGGVHCSLETTLSLTQINSNYLVAMNNTQLSSDMPLYCGKKVIVSVNGQPSDLPLFIGDGCERCGTGSATATSWDTVGAPGLDFSYEVLNELSRGAACADGHIDISWEIVDETLYDFDCTGSGLTQGPVSGPVPGSQASSPPTSSPPSTLTTSIVEIPTETTGNLTQCSDATWRCNSNVLEQCYNGVWNSRATCASGMT
ncbi:uncharacterized protein BHQ10_005056 [Talaromyces amestolkiae]|uniref:LysM domain-containing protein n=1 Tax=Talaromyces amestolkiae TaxID=1196081 RepID=A0A364KZT6_TALAM|nr:uncharacterized protein BHQ10_005056 [Talaromyces amestolkiae]RAO69044.1 hypothetical protein BHQ10_005056 [Talaromyces amestolkiae]